MRIVSLTLVYAFAAILNSSAQTSEHEAIKKAVEGETLAFYARNTDAWQAHWVHDATVTAALVAANQYRYFKGWEDIAARVAKNMKANPTPVRGEFTNTNYNIRQDGNLAWVEYDQLVSGKELSHEYRALVKSGGTWRIVSQVHIASNTFAEGLEGSLNSTGYLLLASGKVKEAVDVLGMNVRLFPNSWNAYDSLGEAYAAAGQKDLAIQNYQKSLELNPNNDNAKTALGKLKGQ